MNDSDLEDIESQLYSQIYHSNDQAEENSNILTADNFEEPTKMRKPNRYFQHNKKNSIFSNKRPIRYESNPKSALQDNCVQTEGFYSKECTRPHKRDISINQVVVLNAQQPTAIVCLTSPEKKKSKLSKWKAKWLAKKKEKKKARAMDKLAKSQQNDIVKEKQKPEENDTITVSDSDDESCVEIANNWPTLTITDSEDEETKNKTNEKVDVSDTITQTVDAVDDVIFVEPTVIPVEVINIDEETNNSPQKIFDGNAHPDVETSSVASGNSFINNYSTNKSPSARTIHQERKELLSTPDSTSNDFMNNSGIQLQRDVFSFSLHGSDFNNDKFVKTNTSTEQCATESSSSTTDPNALNTIKSVVFNEIDFPKEGVFSEANLESFGNFITPLRKKVVKKISQNSTPVEKLSPVPSQNVYSSDTSSESDFGESDTNKTPKKSKNLPDLSPMNNENITKLLQAVKKSKKVKNTSNSSSKYDLLGADSSEVASGNIKHKKRKSNQLNEAPLDTDSSKKKNKNKKRKTNKDIAREATKAINLTTEENSAGFGSTTDLENEDHQNTVVDDNGSKEETENETKRKKKKNREETEESSDSTHSRKNKSKTKKKKIFAVEADQTSENPSTGPTRHDCASQDQTKDEADQNIENIECESIPTTVMREIQSLNEFSFSSCDIKTEKDTEETEELHLEVTNTVNDLSIKVEQDSTTPVALQNIDQNVEKRENLTSEDVHKDNEDVEAEVANEFSELPEDLIVVDEISQENCEAQIISSDNDSNLSALDGQHDIQLVNCKENNSQKQDGNLSTHSEKKPSVDLISCSLEEVQRTMSSDPKLWTILDSDRMPSLKSVGRRCNKCREKGHMAIKCPNVVVPKCRLCGERGHYEPRCPNRICTQCGSRSPYSTTTCKICFQYRTRVCELCYMVGHPSTACPDLWRRYHLTTSEGPPKSSNGPLLKPKSKLWCSGCARSGHLEYTCRYYKSIYPPTDPRIKCYEDVYQDNRNYQQPNVQLQQVVQPLLFGIGNYAPIQSGPIERRNQICNNQNNPQIDSYVGSNLYLNNNGNFLPRFEQNSIPMTQTRSYHDTNNYPPQSQIQQEFFFEDNLPNFISFETPSAPSNYVPISNNCRYYNNCNGAEVQNENLVNNVGTTTEYQLLGSKENARIFFSGTAEKIFNLINHEMQNLSKMTVQVKNVVKDLRKQPIQGMKVGGRSKQKYIKTLNMVLFGIYKMKDGAKHLVKLKNFKMQRSKANKLSQERRRDLYTSYCYIFGISKHNGIDYLDLLRRI